MSLLVVATILVAAAMIAGLVGYVFFYRYTDARAIELGMRPWQAHSGQADDSGATAFERSIHWELLRGQYRTNDPSTLEIGRTSRKWTLVSVGLMVGAIAILAYVH
jgi:hypothetical protein